MQPSTHSAILAMFSSELGSKLLPVFATRKHVAALCAEPRVAIADVVNNRALFLLLMCLDHKLRAICCGSIRSARARARASGCGPAEFAECVVESNQLYAYLLHMLLEGNTHNRPGNCDGLSREVYEFVNAQMEHCWGLVLEDSAEAAAPTYVFSSPLDAATVATLTLLTESGSEMAVTRKFGEIYTSRLRKQSVSLYDIPADVSLRMRFEKKTDPMRAEAIILCENLLNTVADFRALLPGSHAEGMAALANARLPAWVGSHLEGIFKVAIGRHTYEDMLAETPQPDALAGWAWPWQFASDKSVFLHEQQDIWTLKRPPRACTRGPPAGSSEAGPNSAPRAGAFTRAQLLEQARVRVDERAAVQKQRLVREPAALAAVGVGRCVAGVSDCVGGPHAQSRPGSHLLSSTPNAFMFLLNDST
jgi:hypothetical protein